MYACMSKSGEKHHISCSFDFSLLNQTQKIEQEPFFSASCLVSTSLLRLCLSFLAFLRKSERRSNEISGMLHSNLSSVKKTQSLSSAMKEVMSLINLPHQINEGQKVDYKVFIP